MTNKFEKLDADLIQKILVLVSAAADRDEDLFAFEGCNREIKEYANTLVKQGFFDDKYTDLELKKKAKRYIKEYPEKSKIQKIPTATIINISLESTVNDYYYRVDLKIAAPTLIYYNSIVLKKLHKFINESKLIYIIVYETHGDDDTKIIYEQGQKQLGNKRPDLIT